MICLNRSSTNGWGNFLRITVRRRTSVGLREGVQWLECASRLCCAAFLSLQSKAEHMQHCASRFRPCRAVSRLCVVCPAIQQAQSGQANRHAMWACTLQDALRPCFHVPLLDQPSAPMAPELAGQMCQRGAPGRDQLEFLQRVFAACP
ncbi:MAG: hypothetical protein RL186_499 [Pseudomonadota bacterium]